MKQHQNMTTPAARLALSIAVDAQNVTWLEHLSFHGRKVRIEIRSNAYSFQSHAWLDVLEAEPMKWHRIAFLPAAAMDTPEGLCYTPGRETRSEHGWTPCFSADRAALLDLFTDLCFAE